MPLCIAGMHRSGTSMIASLLYACGLDLGPKKDLLPAAPNNPEGFWESRLFLRLNDAILGEQGGSWDHPPHPVFAGWENAPNLQPLYRKAGELMRRFEDREPWGWKDPRNSLTLPFWRKMLPELKILICVRNPLAVAKSLWLRNGISHAASFDLWVTYNRRLLAAAPVADRLVCRCESYLGDSQAELNRVLQWACLPASADEVEHACRRIAPPLMHHRMTLEELAEAGAATDVLDCYKDFMRRSGQRGKSWRV